jgi:exonuclease SbcC
MKIKSVKLKGFIGILKGLGLDEISLNFEGLQGLVALEGANGMGKTTLLENLQPYRILPSRSGTLKSHCFLKDSFKELTFDFAGHEYRTLVKIDALSTRSDEGYIYIDGSQESEVDSKVSNYDAFIVDLLGSSQLYFSSIFCAQNSRKLSDMKPAELKNLFAEFLRLDRYVKWEETSKAAFRICQGAKDNAEDMIQTVDTKISLLGDPGADLAAAVRVLAKSKMDQMLLKDPIKEATDKIERLTKEVAELEVNKKRIGDQEKSILGLKASRIAEDSKIKFRDHDAQVRLEELGADFALQVKIIKGKDQIEQAVLNSARKEEKVDVYQASATNFSTLLQNLSTEASELEKNLYAIQREIDNLPHDIQLMAEKEKLNEARLAYNLNLEAFKKVDDDPELLVWKADIASNEKSAAVLEDIDPGCTSEVCGLITASLESKKRLPDLIAKYEATRREKVCALESERNELTEKGTEAKEAKNLRQNEVDKLLEGKTKETFQIRALINNVEVQTAEFTKNRKENLDMITVTRKEIEKLSDLVAMLPKLQDAEFVAKGIKEDMARIRLALVDSQQAYDVAVVDLTKQTIRAQDIIDSIVINDDAEADLTATQAFLLENADLLVELQVTTASTEKLLITINQEIEQLQGFQVDMNRYKDKSKHAVNESVDWDLMRVACSKNGMRALEIEAVAPVITANSNELLSRTFGPNHSVKFDTVDEDGKEVLVIIVIDPDGTETALHRLSGGEKVWILKALRLAQTLISQEKSGRHFETALMDEEDGALSNDNAIKFIKLYRSFLEMADMQLCFYISHRPEAVAMADSLITFKQGRIEIT